MTRSKTRLGVGDYLPMFQAVDQRAALITIYNQIKGMPILVAFCRDPNAPAGQAFLRDLNVVCREVTNVCHFFAVSGLSVARNAQVAELLGLGILLLSDEDNRIADIYGVGPRSAVDGAKNGTGSHIFLADPNRQIHHVVHDSQKVCHSDLLNLVKMLIGEERYVTSIHPPLLHLPRALDPELCAALIDLHERGGHSQSGFRRDGAGEYFDAEKKVRHDHKVRDPEMVGRLSEAMQKRVIPEVQKAFNFQITRLEEFKIGRYDAADEGHFFPHRDNYGLGYRRFAMSLNLNTGAYEGGYLRFPEYGPSLYRPDTGEAVIFSCSLLHEAMPVESGRRYVLLGFFFDEVANQIRQATPSPRMSPMLGPAPAGRS